MVLLLLLMSAFFLQKINIFCQNGTFTQSKNVSCFSSVFSFCMVKVYCYCLLSRVRLPHSSRLAKNGKNDNVVTICQHDVIVNFFWRCFVSLVNFSYWSMFHVNTIVGSRVFFYKGLARNPEIRNMTVWVFPNIWRLGQVRDTKFDRNVSKKMLLYAAKSQSQSCYLFWAIKGKPIVE